MENPAAVQMEKTAEKNTENNTENSTKEFQPVHTTMVTMTSDDVKIEPVASHKYLFTTSFQYPEICGRRIIMKIAEAGD